jgi:hypothetical protein
MRSAADADDLVHSCRDLPLAHLEREICELAAHIAAATCRWLLLLGEFDRRRGWQVWGVISCAHWLSWRCSIGLRAAREHVRVARRLTELPCVREAFATGELSYCKVRAITRIATPEIEAQLVELARHATGAQLEKVVRGYRGALDATAARSVRQDQRRYLDVAWDDDGCLSLKAKLPPEQGAVILAALQLAQRELPAMHRRGPDGQLLDESSQCSAEHQDLDRPAGARRADALTLIAECAIHGGLCGLERSDGVQLVVHVDAETLAQNRIVERSELEEGPALDPETVRRLGCDATLERIVERDGQPLSVGRRRRTIPPALRRALRARDHSCRFPGCTHTGFLHAHHIHHWARGGPTNLDNLVQLCSYHHRLVHEGGYQVENAGRRGVCFQRPDGRAIPDVPARASGSAATLRGGQRDLRISARTCKPLSAGDRIDYDLAVLCLLAKAGFGEYPRGP